MTNTVLKPTPTVNFVMLPKRAFEKGAVLTAGRGVDALLVESVGPSIAKCLSITSDWDLLIKTKQLIELAREKGETPISVNLSDGKRTEGKYTFASREVDIPSPFMTYRVTSFPKVDFFTETTGVGPVPVTEDTFKHASKVKIGDKEYKVVGRDFLCAVNLNSISASHERINRGLLLIFDYAAKKGSKAAVEEVISPTVSLISESCARFEEIRRETNTFYSVFREERFRNMYSYTREKLPRRLESEKNTPIRIAERFNLGTERENEKLLGELVRQLERMD